MDAQTIIALASLAFTGGVSVVAVAVHATKTRDVADGASHRARNVEAALTLHVSHDDSVYVRKETLGPQLDAITKALERIEGRQTTLIERFMGPGA